MPQLRTIHPGGVAIRSGFGRPATRQPANGNYRKIQTTLGPGEPYIVRHEVRWYINLLDGVSLTPNSGLNRAYDTSVTSDGFTLDINYWHPSMRQFELSNTRGPGLDLYFQAGFPDVLNLPYQARRTFQATGLGMPWYAAYGNHDALVQGNLPIGYDLSGLDVGDLATSGLPAGHGFSRGTDHAYYVLPDAPYDQVRHIMVDTTYPGGGANGWLDDNQFRWLESLLKANSSRYLNVTSDGGSRTWTCGSTGTTTKTTAHHGGGRPARVRAGPQHSIWPVAWSTVENGADAFPPPVVVPNLVGKRTSDALETIGALGLNYRLDVNLTKDCEDEANVVIRQDPTPGVYNLPPGSTIAITIPNHQGCPPPP